MRSRPTFADLLAFNLAVLRQGRDVALAYLSRSTEFAERAGPHLRHVVEHFDALIAGVDRGGVDYDHRQRDRGVETDPQVCVARFDKLLDDVRALERCEPGAALTVGFVIGLGGDSFSLSQSTLARELQFVASHAIHHYALLKPVLQAAGVAVPDDLGKAPETVRHLLVQVVG